MDSETIAITIFFTFMIGAGVGFYVTKLLIGV
jgi:hypothetical protein